MCMLRSWPTKIPNMNKIQQKTNDQLRTQGLGTDERTDGRTDGRTRVFQYTHHSASGGIIKKKIHSMLIIRDMQSIFLSGLIFKFLQLTAYLIDQCSLKIKNLSSGFKFFYLFFCIKINFICHSKYSVTKVRFHIIMWNFRVKNSTYFYPCSESLH